jgi:hypothetical protein
MSPEQRGSPKCGITRDCVTVRVGVLVRDCIQGHVIRASPQEFIFLIQLDFQGLFEAAPKSSKHLLHQPLILVATIIAAQLSRHGSHFPRKKCWGQLSLYFNWEKQLSLKFLFKSFPPKLDHMSIASFRTLTSQ